MPLFMYSMHFSMLLWFCHISDWDLQRMYSIYRYTCTCLSLALFLSFFLSFFLSLFLSFSLSLTHVHTHTHSHSHCSTGDFVYQRTVLVPHLSLSALSYSLSALYSLALPPVFSRLCLCIPLSLSSLFFFLSHPLSSPRFLHQVIIITRLSPSSLDKLYDYMFSSWRRP